MHVKIGCMTRPWMNYPVERALEGIARAGFTYTAYVGNHEKQPSYTLDSSPAEIQALRNKVESAGLVAVAAWAGDPLRYGSDGLRRHVELARDLGLEFLILSSPYTKERLRPDLPIGEEFVAIVESVLPLAERTGVSLHVKPHMGEYGAGPGLATLAQWINHPRFGVSYDPGNIHSYEGLRADQDITTVAPHVRSLCVKDHKAGQQVKRYVTPGDGDVNWGPVWQSLADANFSGYALVELLGGTAADELDKAAVTARQRMMAWIEGAGGSIERSRKEAI